VSEGARFMLKLPVRSEIKESIILLIFATLMWETLTSFTVVLVFVGAIMVWFKKRPNHLIRNVVTLGLFGAYWLTYGKLIDPEVGINFLTSVVTIKLLEKETERDRYMIFFGLILLISTGSLFQRNLSYVFFFGASFFILIQDFYGHLKLQSRIVDLLKTLIWVLPLTALLFFFVPRIMNPFQMGQGTPKNGEVGYTPEVNIAHLESLASNDSPVFQASVDGNIPPEDLYWRGNTLSFSDGWNWPVMPQDMYQRPFVLSPVKNKGTGINQSIRVFKQQEFFFALDHPARFVTAKGSVELNSNRSLSQNRWQPTLRYQVIGEAGGIPSGESDRPDQNSTGLRSNEKAWIHQHFQSRDLPGLQKEIQLYFQREAFSYSLSPGKVKDFLDFMENKKIGFCSHYASAVAQVLRAKGIRARLVSGFMGGGYNKFAGYYLVTQNDAHVWIEAIHNGEWIRIDPTGWIAPDRIRLGGEAYMQKVNPVAFSAIRNFGRRFELYNDWQQWIAQWDFKFYQWLEEMDYYGQDALFEKLRFKREWIFTFIPLLLVFFVGIYIWQMTFRNAKLSPHEALWFQFKKKMHKRGINLSLYSLREAEEMILPQDEEVKNTWKQLVDVSFKHHTEAALDDLRQRIKKL
jgi:hypothetical protein